MYGIFRSTVVLKVCAVGVSTLAVWLFLVRSPFPRWQKTLFVLGIYPLYEYSVMARNYGIAMLLLFCFAALYRERFRRPILTSIVVFLLAQTNAYGLVTACCLLSSLLLEALLTGRLWNLPNGVFKLNGKLLVSISIMALGAVLAVLTILPDQASKVTSVSRLDFLRVEHWLRAFEQPTKVFGLGFGVDWFTTHKNQQLAWLLVWGLGLWLLRRPFLFLAVAGAYAGMGAFASTVYGAVLRHQGTLFMLVIAMLWVDRSLPAPRYPIRIEWPKLVRKLFALFPQAALTFFLVLQIPKGFTKIKRDYDNELSSAKRFGEFIASHREFERAIIIGDPDYLVESLPYYAKNDQYYPREARFKHYASFTQENRSLLSLAELVNTARTLKDNFNVPVLIALNYKLGPRGPFNVRFSYGNLHYSKEMYEDFAQSTRKVASFNEGRLTHEVYDVYALR
jgi:hypothetical protein